MRQLSRTVRIAVVVIVGVLAVPGFARASFWDLIELSPVPFDDAVPDVRSRALGGAVLAIPSGPAEVWWSPTALPTGHNLEFQYSPVQWPLDFSLRTMAAAAEWRNLRLCVAQTWLDMEPMPVRTAYQPEGNDTYFDLDYAATTVNISADLVPWAVSGRSNANLVCGVSARRLSTDFMSSKVSVWDMDVGLLAAQRWEGEYTWVRLRATAMLRNALESEFSIEQLSTRLPAVVRYGAACEIGMVPEPGRRVPLQVALAYGRAHRPHEEYPREGDHFGLEASIFELVSPRLGYAPDGAPGEFSYGLGLQLARPGTWPLGVRVDYAREDWGIVWGWRSQWSAGVYGDL